MYASNEIPISLLLNRLKRPHSEREVTIILLCANTTQGCMRNEDSSCIIPCINKQQNTLSAAIARIPEPVP